jgi:hypothetical protein
MPTYFNIVIRYRHNSFARLSEYYLQKYLDDQCALAATVLDAKMSAKRLPPELLGKATTALAAMATPLRAAEQARIEHAYTEAVRAATEQPTQQHAAGTHRHDDGLPMYDIVIAGADAARAALPESPTILPLVSAQLEIFIARSALFDPTTATSSFEVLDELGHRVPTLRQLARQILSIPASEIACERLFSYAGQVLTTQRAAMTISTANRVVVLRNNQDLKK